MCWLRKTIGTQNHFWHEWTKLDTKIKNKNRSNKALLLCVWTDTHSQAPERSYLLSKRIRQLEWQCLPCRKHNVFLNYLETRDLQWCPWEYKFGHRHTPLSSGPEYQLIWECILYCFCCLVSIVFWSDLGENIFQK